MSRFDEERAFLARVIDSELCAALGFPGLLADYAESLTLDNFTDNNHKLLWSILSTIHEPITLESIAELLDKKGHSDLNCYVTGLLALAIDDQQPVEPLALYVNARQSAIGDILLKTIKST